MLSSTFHYQTLPKIEFPDLSSKSKEYLDRLHPIVPVNVVVNAHERILDYVVLVIVGLISGGLAIVRMKHDHGELEAKRHEIVLVDRMDFVDMRPLAKLIWQRVPISFISVFITTTIPLDCSTSKRFGFEEGHANAKPLVISHFLKKQVLFGHAVGFGTSIQIRGFTSQQDIKALELGIPGFGHWKCY